MTTFQTTCWTLIDQAAIGECAQRQEFATRYSPVVSAYMVARWRGTRQFCDVEDACQEVFAECFRDNGPLARADRDRPGGFRAFLYGIARNVALRIEQRQLRDPALDAELDLIEADETSLSHAFDRAWAVEVIKAAGQKQAELAEQDGAEAVRRVELLQLRFRDGMPIRDIARLWKVDAELLHGEFRKARRDFLHALRTVVIEDHERASDREVDQQCRELLELLK